jgi:FdhD protein
LVVSGRASFEIVQKATVACIPVVASVSAASSLAIDLAERSQIALAAFVRGRNLNVYTHPERIDGPAR